MSNQLVELTLTPSQAATLLYCLKKQAITTDEGAIESFAVERSQLLEKFTPEQLGKQLMSEELNLIANYQESLTAKDNCTHCFSIPIKMYRHQSLTHVALTHAAAVLG